MDDDDEWVISDHNFGTDPFKFVVNGLDSKNKQAIKDCTISKAELQALFQGQDEITSFTNLEDAILEFYKDGQWEKKPTNITAADLRQYIT